MVTASSLPVASTCTSNGRELARPAQTLLVAGALGDRGDGAGDPDPVGAHGHRDELAVLVEHLEPERLGVLPAELEDVAHLDAAGQLQRSGPVRGRVAGPDLGGLDRPVGGEVPPAGQLEHVPARLVGAGQPPGARTHPRVDQVADLRRAVRTRARSVRGSP